MSQNKYFNDAIIGNEKIMATYTSKGKLLRMYFPTRDSKQFIDYFNTGVKINDSYIIYTDNDINNIYKQYYTEDTNVLNTEITNSYFNLKICQTDFVCIKHDMLVKKYKFINENTIDLDVKFLIHSKLKSDENNFASGKVFSNGLMQYAHDYTMSIFSNKQKISSHQIHGSKNNIYTGIIQDKDYIGMSNDSSISYEIGKILPGEEKELTICIYINNNKELNNISDIEDKISKLKKINIEKEEEKTVEYWRNYVKEHNLLDLKIGKSKYDKKVYDIYIRTILLFPLLTNSQTGGIIASPEVDESFEFCGRYAYCWPRDAVFITKAMDILGMTKETDKFFTSFCRMTQSHNGMWEQRFFTDGTLAPCWGYQIDETASVVYGVHSHYLKTKDIKFLKSNLKMCEKAIVFLEEYIDDFIKENQKMQMSYDLWEMHEGISLYSLACIFGSFKSMLEIYEAVKETYEKNRIRQEQIIKTKEKIEKNMLDIKRYVLSNLYDNTRKSFVRNAEDKKIDISILGAIVQFNMFEPKEVKIKNTIENIELNLRTYTGGYKRFENDHYKNGNPWIIATLWMAMYYKKIGDRKKVKELLDFVIKSATPLGFLPEQVNNETMEPAWVNMLGWSHAMFIAVLEEI